MVIKKASQLVKPFVYLLGKMDILIFIYGHFNFAIIYRIKSRVHINK
jgi:hypothetical protein